MSASTSSVLPCAVGANPALQPLMADEPWQSAPALQQPAWSDPLRAATVRAELAQLPGLVTWEEIQTLRMLLAEAAVGKYQIIQAGDCAEDPADCEPGQVERKASLLDALAWEMERNTGKPVIRIGRIGGQFGKPRSAPTEMVDGCELPVYRGHLVNSPAPTERDRRADPERMLTCYQAACRATSFLRHRAGGWTPGAVAAVWTSHEALVLDYELPLLRPTPTGQMMLTSTHLPWIGERTRQLNGSHVQLLAEVANPVACKVGPTMTPDDVEGLCVRLDPRHEPGRLTLIVRMGATKVSDALPPLVAAVRSAGHSVAWVCDPMHGNTVKAPGGMKTRMVQTLIEEIVAFQRAVADGGGIGAGLHLETTPDEVTECVWNEVQLDRVCERYTSLCDPRLNRLQAITVAGVWDAAEPY